MPESNAISPMEVRQVSKAFGVKEVLDSFSLTLQKGEVFGLIGLNGTGKTTLIKIALDLLESDAGEVSFFGLSSKETVARKNIAYLPEKFQPSKYLKGHEYLEMALSYYGKKYDKKVVIEEAKAVALDPAALDKKVGSYSKGMGQKLGLIGAILSQPPLLILDEPMSGLDPRARILLKERLLKVKAEGGTVFFSSHILADMDEICDRVGVMHDAELLFVGNPSELREKWSDESLERAFLKVIDAHDSAKNKAA